MSTTKRSKAPKTRKSPIAKGEDLAYASVLREVANLVEEARRASARAVNSLMTATYWAIGARIVEEEQGGDARAVYGEDLIRRLSRDLTKRFGRGFGRTNLAQMKRFYLTWTPDKIVQTASGLSIAQTVQTASGQSWPTSLKAPETAFPLPWSDYVRLMYVDNPAARAFYEQEALRGGWSVRQLARQIDSQFYERTALSKNKAAMLEKGQQPQPSDLVSPDEEVKDPLVLEFLGLKDEYSESELEDALIHHLEAFLLELGNDFTFVGRQRRLRIDDAWYRVDLLFFHRRLRCLVIIDLKLGRFTHDDAGQMHMYLNYAREHWTHDDENPPVGVILCAGKSEALVRYATENLPNKLLVREYLTVLPDEHVLAEEIQRTRKLLEARRPPEPKSDETVPAKPPRGRP